MIPALKASIILSKECPLLTATRVTFSGKLLIAAASRMLSLIRAMFEEIVGII
jgi:hypothetical protein